MLPAGVLPVAVHVVRAKRKRPEQRQNALGAYGSPVAVVEPVDPELPGPAE